MNHFKYNENNLGKEDSQENFKYSTFSSEGRKLQKDFEEVKAFWNKK
jgi:hypothetical protein